MKNVEFDLSPTGLTKILAEYGMAIDQIKDYERIQNSSVIKMAERVDSLDRKIESKIERLSNQNVEILERISDLKDAMHRQNLSVVQLVHENNEKFRELDRVTDAQREVNLKQRMTWFIAVAIGLPGVVWSCIQVINFFVGG